MGKEKIFRDATQGYIEIDELYTFNLIDTFQMQRLKDVAQTGIRSVYSGATHDRFSHSLGVYNIGLKLYASFSSNLIAAAKKHGSLLSDQKSKDIVKWLKEYNAYYQVACLLHDIGHPAFSHTFEYLYNNSLLNLDTSTDSEIKIDEVEALRIKGIVDTTTRNDKCVLENAFKAKIDEHYKAYRDSDGACYVVDTDRIKASPHELMGALQVLTENAVQDAIKSTIEVSNGSSHNVDYGFIACMIVGAKYETAPKSSITKGLPLRSCPLKASIRNCVVELLNGAIDSDGIDYLNRNSHFAGYSTSNVDITRLTSAVSAQYDTHTNMFIPCFEKSALSAIEGFINARDFESKWLYGHHKIIYDDDFLTPFLYKKSSRYLFATDQSQWEKAIVSNIKKDLESSKALGRYASLSGLNESWKTCWNSLSAKVEKLFPRGILDPDAAKERAKADALPTALLGDIGILKHNSVSTALNTIKTLRPLFSLNEFCCGLMKELTQNATVNNCEEIIEISKIISDWYNVLVNIKDAYLGYIMAPVKKFARNSSGTNIPETIYFKSTDSDIDALFKRQYLYYANKSFSDLTPAEIGVGDELEFSMYQDALCEYHTRRYRQSLWKSQAEYGLFLSHIGKDTGVSEDELNEILIDYITTKGRIEEFEDNAVFKASPLKDANAVFLRQKTINDGSDSLLGEAYENVFNCFGDGLVICIHKEKHKYFGKMNIHIGNDALLDESSNGLISYEKLTGCTAQNFRYIPYIFYKKERLHDDFKGKGRAELLKELKKNIITYVVGNCIGDSRMQVNTSMPMNGKTIRDSVHGDIFVPQRFGRIIDTKAFQRLRRIKQLATADFVYPEATHTRFAHSLGTFYIMSLMLDHFCALFNHLQIPYSELDKDAALAAALLHDIGHGPYSHAYENIAKNSKSHEAWTIDIVKNDKELNEVFKTEFENNFKERLLDCLSGSTSSCDGFKLKDVFSCLISSQLDADRIDYLMRDSYNTGINFGTLDFQKIISAMTLTEYNGKMSVCIDESAVPSIEQFFIGRYNMYDSVYFAPYKVFSEGLLEKIGRRISDLEFFPSKSLMEKIYDDSISLEQYLSLDDASFQREIYNCVAYSKDAILKEMVDCFYDRRGYSRLRVFNESVTDNIGFIEDFSKRYHALITDYYGVVYAVKSYSAYDVILNKTTEPNKMVLVSKRNGTITDFASASRVFAQHTKPSGEHDYRLWNTNKSYIYINNDILKMEWDYMRKNQNELKRFFENYDIRKHTEIEQKYSCKKSDIDKAKNLKKLFSENSSLQGYSVKSSEDMKTQSDTYYDTADLLLEGTGYSLRCRSFTDGQYVFTVKKSIDPNNGSNNGQFIRSEFEYPTISNDIHAKKIEEFLDNNLKKLFASKGIENYLDKLNKIVEIENDRISHVVKRDNSDFLCELSLDSVVYIHNGDRRPDYQIEIELKSENPIHRIELRDFADKFKAVMDIKDEDNEVESKYLKALREFGLI